MSKEILIESKYKNSQNYEGWNNEGWITKVETKKFEFLSSY